MKQNLERLWQVWWALWHQTWGSPSLLKQNPPHSKLSRFFHLEILVQQFFVLAGGQLVHGGHLPRPLPPPWRPHGYQVNLLHQLLKLRCNVLFSSPEIVSTSTVSGCQPFCPIPNFVCQGRHIKNSSATRFNADHQIISRPVLEQPNLYARKIITHFNHLFVPRKGEGKPLNFPFCFVNPNLNSMSVFGFKVV